MEAVAALSLAGTVFQITDFVATVLSKSAQLYTSADGSLIDNSDAAEVATHLRNLSSRLRRAPHGHDATLDELCHGAQEIADRLLAALDKLKVKGKQSRAESLRKALRSVWGKDELVRLEGRTHLERLEDEQSKGFKKLEGNSQSESRTLLEALKKHQATTLQRLDTHIDQVLSLHTEVQRGTHQALQEFKVALEARMKDRLSVKIKDRNRINLSVATELHNEGFRQGDLHDSPAVLIDGRENVSAEIRKLRQDITSLAGRLSQIEEDRRASDRELKRIILATSSSNSNSTRKELQAQGQQESLILMLLQTLYDHLAKSYLLIRSIVVAMRLDERVRGPAIYSQSLDLPYIACILVCDDRSLATSAPEAVCRALRPTSPTILLYVSHHSARGVTCDAIWVEFNPNLKQIRIRLSLFSMDLEMGVLTPGSQSGSAFTSSAYSPTELRPHAEQPRVLALAAAARKWIPNLPRLFSPVIPSRPHDGRRIPETRPVDIRVVEDYPEGYPRLGCFMDSDESFLIYRRFGGVFSRLILNKQDELRAMEQRLFMMDQEDAENDPKRLMSRTYDLQKDADPNVDKTLSRSFLLAQMERAALEYSHLLTHAKQLVAMNRPTASERRNVQTYIHNTKPLTAVESAFLSDENDLVTLRPGRSPTVLDGFVESVVRLLDFRLIK
ncbi:MAG: hypothetical protein Q9195_008536, partial [Heterodermia aff. obscurata]